MILTPVCRACRHMKPGKIPACDAFPEGIPGEILIGQTGHVAGYPGDNGIHFEINDPAPVYYIAGDSSFEVLFRIGPTGDCERYVPILDRWETDNEFLHVILEDEDMFRHIDSYEADAFVETEQVKRESMNPCALNIKQALYLQSREAQKK